MAKRIPDGIKVEMSSGNVFANLGLPDAEQLKIKSGLVIEIKLTPTTDTVGHRTLAVT
jgi:predicted XRE-type DNA-binding protein